MLTRRIIPSVTTLSTAGSSWKTKIQEIGLLRINEVGLFLTGLSADERPECYALLEEMRGRHAFRIPFVHAVSSMPEDEYRYLMREFGTEKFNLHPLAEFPLEHELSAEVRHRIYIENTFPHSLTLKDIQGFGGICFDLSHLEQARRMSGQEYHRLLALTSRASSGANHISAIDQANGLSCHRLSDATSLRYLCSLHPSAFAPLCAVELENPLEEQLCVIPMIQRAMYRAAANAWLEEAA